MNSRYCPTEKTSSHETSTHFHRPQSQIAENETGSSVHIALPGVRKEDLKLNFLAGSLHIEAPRHANLPENWKTHRAPEPIERYALKLQLTSRLDGNKTTAALADGVLVLHIPTREEAKPRPIEVN